MTKARTFFSICFIMLFCCSCSQEKIELTEELTFSWDKENQRILEDDDFQRIENGIEKYRPKIIECIAEQELTEIEICNKKTTKITKGVLAYLLLDQIDHIPPYLVFQMQFDSFTLPCPYPHGLIEYISENPTEVIQKLKVYYTE